MVKKQNLWLDWAREIQAIGQTGIAYGKDEYDRQRYRRLLKIAAEIVGEHTTYEQPLVLADFLLQTGYATPKIDVRGAVIMDGQILLVQERSDERWCLPGGWADVGVGPAENVVCEVREESGFNTHPKQIIGIYNANETQEPLAFYHAYKIIFLCEIVGGKPQPSEETMAVKFFPFDALPLLSSNRTNERHLRDVQAYIQDDRQQVIFE